VLRLAANDGLATTTREVTILAVAGSASAPARPIGLTDPGTQVETPVLSPASGSYGRGILITVTCATASATSHYTTNGVAPTEADPVIPSGSYLLLDAGKNIQAAGWASGLSPSNVASETYSVRLSTVAAGGFHSLALTDAGVGWSWGSNANGQL